MPPPSLLLLLIILILANRVNLHAEASEQPFLWTYLPAARISDGPLEVESHEPRPALAVVLLKTRTELAAIRDNRTDSDGGLLGRVAVRFREQGRAGVFAFLPNNGHELFRKKFEQFNDGQIKAFKSVLGQFLAIHPHRAVVVMSGQTGIAGQLYAALPSSSTRTLLLFPDETSELLPIPVFHYSGALETGNLETGYKLHRADWAVCSLPVAQTVFSMWDVELWFDRNGTEYMLEKVANLTTCEPLYGAKKRVGDRGSGMEEKAILGTLLDKKAGTWPRFASCVDGKRLTNVWEFLKGGNVLLITAPDALFCNFYLGQFTHDGLYLSPFSGDDLSSNPLWSPRGYVVGTLHVHRQRDSISWLQLEPRAWGGYGGLLTHGADPVQARREWEDELLPAIEAHAFPPTSN